MRVTSPDQHTAPASGVLSKVRALYQYAAPLAILGVLMVPFLFPWGDQADTPNGYEYQSMASGALPAPPKALPTMEPWMMPSQELLYAAFQDLEAARREVLRCVHGTDASQLDAAARQYREATAVWRTRYRNLRDRLSPNEMRYIVCEVFGALTRSETTSPDLYQWETEDSNQEIP